MHSKPVVALLSVGELFGGVERHLLGSCQWFQRWGVDPILILFFDRELAHQAREHGVTPIILENSGSCDLSVPRRLARVLADRRVDVVHAHGYRAVVNGALAHRYHPFAMVRTVHGLVEPSRPLSLTWVKSNLYDRLEHVAAAWGRAETCYVTDDLRRRRTGGRPTPGPRERVVHNGIDPLLSGVFTRPPDLPAGAFNFAAVGRVTPVKGLETALHALRKMGPEGNPVLSIIGTGPSLAGLETLAAELGVAARVRFLGFRQNIYDYLAHVDALIMPSHHEGLPYTVLEAMSLATPIIASRVGGLAEVLVAGETALLVEPADVGGWAAAMRSLMQQED
ncbi:MAG: glycosyltransferase, partial [Gammaproteobacteria bacterium]|nr:glycosyltransferase [Gammaproteobacteria bacterium]